MSAVGEIITEFLEEGGDDLGYDSNNMPAIKDMDRVLERGVKVWEYFGITEQEYYGG
tara:strand:- start:245 stop:415 length:171 start_codon:yes stop_codon:yes gene_type:complete